MSTPPDKHAEETPTPIAAAYSSTSPNLSASSMNATLASTHPPNSTSSSNAASTSTPTSPIISTPGRTASPNLTPLSSTPLSGARNATGSHPSSPTQSDKHTLPSWLWHTTTTTSYASDRAGTRRRDVRERRLFGMVVSAHAQEESLDGRDGLERRDGGLDRREGGQESGGEGDGDGPSEGVRKEEVRDS